MYPSIHKSWHENSPTGGGLLVGIFRLRTKDGGVTYVIRH
jgi:hypothetical protein